MHKHQHQTELRRVIECVPCKTLLDIPYDEPRHHADGMFTLVSGWFYRCISCYKITEAQIFVDQIEEDDDEETLTQSMGLGVI